jgi:tRNA 2-thiouridine synthesizing protein D
LLAENEAKRQGKLDNDLADGFRIAGLGLWVEGLLQTDRFAAAGLVRTGIYLDGVFHY